MEGIVGQGRHQIYRDINNTKYLHKIDEIYYIYIVYAHTHTCKHREKGAFKMDLN